MILKDEDKASMTKTPVYGQGLVSIVLATFNEKENIERTIRGIFASVSHPVEVIVVDDDSIDQTWRVATDLDDERVKVIRRIGTRGLASAFMRGILESRGEIIGWMDADSCMPPQLLPVMIEALRGNDVVIGSRYAKGGKDLRQPIRVWSSRLINSFASAVLGYGIKDYDSGFVVVRRTVFDRVLPIPRGYGEYFIEFVYTCCRKGLRVCEVPYVFTDRTQGISKSFPGVVGFLLLGMRYAIRIAAARIKKIE